MPPATKAPLQAVRRDGTELLKLDCAIRSDSAKSTEMIARLSYDEILSRMGELLVGVKRHRTQALIQEVCINYLLGRCPWSSCHRIHPCDKSPFFEMYLEWYRAHQQRRASSAHIRLASSAEYVEPTQPIVLENADLPIVNLPKLKSPRYFAGDMVAPVPCFGGALDDDISPSDLPSWDSETGCWITPSDSHSWTCGSSSVSSRANSPTWDPRDMGQRKGFTDGWFGNGNSSDIASSECSTLYSKVSHSREPQRGSRFTSVQVLEKCERWTNSLRSNQSSIAGLEERHRRPPHSDRCRLWLRGECNLGYACKFVHDDLEYAAEEEPKQDSRLGSPSWVTTVHDYVKVKFAAGFHVENATTGFETSIVLVHGVPNRMATDELLHLLQPFGTVSDIRMVEKSFRPTKTARVFFSKPEEAQSALSGIKSVAPNLTSEMPVSASNRNAIFKDGMVVVEWHPPGKTWYAGYSSAADARNAIAQCRAMAWDNPVVVQVHKGLPAVGVVTVRFRGLPADFNEDGMKRFGNPTSVMWERPKYTNLGRATGAIRSILDEFGPVLSFQVRPPSSRDFKHKAYAQFSSPTAADAACNRIHGICPMFTGKTKIFAYHDKHIEYRIAPETFARTASDIDALQQQIWERYRYNASLVIPRHFPVVIIELHARELKILGQIKLKFEKLLSGEIVKHNGKVVWDEFFAQPTGIEYLQVLQDQSIGVTIRNEMTTRKIRLFGSPTSRGTIASQIIAKVIELRAQQISFIPLGGQIIVDFMNKEVRKLQHELGPENVVLDLFKRGVSVRGGEAIQCKARDFVLKVSRQSKPQGHKHLCPVCFSEPTQSIRLGCGHCWCRGCLSSYLLSAMTNKSFPLCCLGDEAKCDKRIPLSVASDLLSDVQFQAIAEAAFAAYVQGHSEEFHYCPSPDCQQVYRVTEKSLAGTTVQCPSCLLRICPACHHEAHDGFSCADDDDWDQNLQEWAKDHDAKRCPGCGITIERMEGCNHMTCAKCQTHICWVCLKTFPKGQGIYAHMRAEHGDFGLGPIM